MVLVDAVFSFRRISPFVRVRLRFVALTAVMALLVASASIKEYRYCIALMVSIRYGGDAPFNALLDSVPTGVDMDMFSSRASPQSVYGGRLVRFWLPHKTKAALAAFCAGLVWGCCWPGYTADAAVRISCFILYGLHGSPA